MTKQVLNFSRSDLLKLPHRGHRSTDDIASFLCERGYVLNDDQAHRDRIYAEIIEDLESINADDYVDEVEAIAAGRIRHLTINY